MEIRKATAKDARALSNLVHAYDLHEKKLDSLFVPDKNPLHTARDFLKRGVVYVAGEKPVAFVNGYISVRNGRKLGILGNIFVSVKYRNKGTGTALVDMLVRWFKHKRVKYVQSFVQANNTRSLAMWKKKGFKVSGQQIRKKL